MSAPVVGISSYLDIAQSGLWDLQAVFLPWTYGEALVSAGAVAVVLPPQPALVLASQAFVFLNQAELKTVTDMCAGLEYAS